MKQKTVRIEVALLALLVGVAIGALVFRVGEKAPQTVTQEGLRQDLTVPVAGEDEKRTSTQERAEEITDPKYLLALAEVHFRFGDSGKAEELTNRALGLTEDGATLRQLRGMLSRVYEKEERWADALKLEEEAAEAPIDEYDRYETVMAQAKIHVRLDNLDEAEELLDSMAASTTNVWRKREISKGLAQIWQKDPKRMAAAYEGARDDASKQGEVATALEIVARDYCMMQHLRPLPASLLDC